MSEAITITLIICASVDIICLISNIRQYMTDKRRLEMDAIQKRADRLAGNIKHFKKLSGSGKE